MKIYNYYYKIVDLVINIKIPCQYEIGYESKNFICDKEDGIEFKFKEIEEPLSIDGELVTRNRVKIYRTKDKIIHEFYSTPEEPYAWRIPTDIYNYQIKYLKGFEKNFKYSRSILEAINIEDIMRNFNAFILHSSFIKYKEKAILFSAPSGVGKSTQAELWNKYENAEIINGDRAGIRKIDEKWIAYGIPFAGSSHIYKNDKAEISHIIVLRQGEKNKLMRLSPREAFIKIYSETTIHTWDEKFHKDIVDLITDLVKDVPVYLYECVPNKSAVEFLKNIIKDDEDETKISRT